MIYIVSDQKQGHLSQSRGLADAIARQIEVEIHELDDGQVPAMLSRSSSGEGIILAAGRKACHAARQMKQTLNLPAIALMNPGWWMRRQFDLCVIPRHDGVAERGNVIQTEGALNGIQPADEACHDEGLILLGGPSKHYSWDAAGIQNQLNAILDRDSNMNWTATDSRRTPESTSSMLQSICDASKGRLRYTPASQTPRGWIGEQLSRCGVCWVTEDSVSMVYESLTAGARVGLLPVPRKSAKPGRVVRGVESLIERGWVGTFNNWSDGQALPADRPPLAEADRVAAIIIERWLTTSLNA